jgi:hypothetical protein
MWLKPENRCLVPANSFAEYAPEPNPQTKKKDVVWFALNDARPLFAFAGIWTTFNGDRGTVLFVARDPCCCTGPMGAIGTRLSLRPLLREGGKLRKPRASHAARVLTHALALTAGVRRLHLAVPELRNRNQLVLTNELVHTN